VDTSQVGGSILVFVAGVSAGGVVLGGLITSGLNMLQRRAELARDRERDHDALRQRLRDERAERLRISLRLVVEALSEWIQAAELLRVPPNFDPPEIISARRERVAEMCTKAEQLLDRGRADLLLDEDGAGIVKQLGTDVMPHFTWLLDAPLWRQIIDAQSAKQLAQKFDEHRDDMLDAINALTVAGRALLARLDLPVMDT
jgi:hypothetical protein